MIILKHNRGELLFASFGILDLIAILILSFGMFVVGDCTTVSSIFLAGILGGALLSIIITFLVSFVLLVKYYETIKVIESDVDSFNSKEDRKKSEKDKIYFELNILFCALPLFGVLLGSIIAASTILGAYFYDVAVEFISSDSLVNLATYSSIGFSIIFFSVLIFGLLSFGFYNLVKLSGDEYEQNRLENDNLKRAEDIEPGVVNHYEPGSVQSVPLRGNNFRVH